MKVCRYRNCKKEILSGRKDKQFCNGSCKRMEQTYRKRQKKKDEKINKITSIITRISDFEKLQKNSSTINEIFNNNVSITSSSSTGYYINVSSNVTGCIVT